jgi:hypothetical protein
VRIEVSPTGPEGGISDYGKPRIRIDVIRGFAELQCALARFTLRRMKQDGRSEVGQVETILFCEHSLYVISHVCRVSESSSLRAPERPTVVIPEIASGRHL